MPNLTKNEIKALKMCLNYNNRADQLSDNYSNAGAEEIANMLFSGDKFAAGELIASLTAKGMGEIANEDDAIFWITELGVNTIFDLLDKDPNVYTVIL